MGMDKAKLDTGVRRAEAALDELLLQPAEHSLPQDGIMEELVAVRVARPRQEVGGMDAAGVEVALALQCQQCLLGGLLDNKVDLPARG